MSHTTRVVLVCLITYFGIVHCESTEILDPPEVLISTQTQSQAQRRVVFTFEWNQDVSKKFSASDVVINDSKGRKLKFRSWGIIEKSKIVPNYNYYGDGVVKVDAMTAPYSPGRKFYGVVVAPKKGWVEAYVPELKVCASGLCNGLSSPVRVSVKRNQIACVRVSSNVVESDELTLPLTFDFAEDVAPNSFKRKHVQAFVYSLDKILPDVPLKVSRVIGGPRKFYATLEAINYAKLPFVEVWVRGRKIRSKRGGRFCESNHFRLKLSKKAFLSAEADVAPQNRQFTSLTLPYGLPSVMQPMPAGIPYRPVAYFPRAPVATTSGLAQANNFADESVSSVKLYLNSIQTPNIMDAAVTGVKLSNNAVGNAALHDGAITGQKLGNFAVDTRSLADDAVDGKKLDASIKIIPQNLLDVHVVDVGALAQGAINGEKIAPGGIELGSVGDVAGKLRDPNMIIPGSKLGGITTPKIADQAVTIQKLNPYVSNILKMSFGSSGISPGAITSKKLSYGSVTPLKLANGAVMGNDIAAGAASIDKIANEAVNTASLMDGAVSDNKISRSVPVWGNDDIIDRSFLINKLDPRLISQFGLSNDVVTSEMIVDRNVNARTIGEDAITSIKLGAGGVEARDLAHGSISRDKLISVGGIVITDGLADGAGIIGSNIANEAVSANALAPDSVTTLKIGDKSVDNVHLDEQVVTRLKMGEKSVGAQNILDGSVTNNKVGDGTVTNNALGDDSVTFDKVMPIAVIGENFQDKVIANKYISDLAVGSKAFSGDAITSKKMVDLAIQKDNLATGAVTEQGLADNSITKAMLQDSAVYGENYGKSSIIEVPDGSVLGRKIETGGIGAGDIVPNAIDQPLVRPGSITSNGFEDDSITFAKFADASVTVKKVREKGVDANEIADLAITTKKLAQESVPGVGVADGQITNNHMKDKNVTTRSMHPDAVTAEDIFSVLPSVSSEYLADDAVATNNMKNNIIQAGKVAENTVVSSNLGTGAVIRTVVGDDAVLATALGDESIGVSNLFLTDVIDNSKFKDGGTEDRHFSKDSISTTKFGSGSVHSDAYDDNVITQQKLDANFAITSLSVGNSSIQTEHIVDGAVTDAKIGAKSIQANAFAEDSVGADHIVDRSVISRHFANRSVTASKMQGAILVDTPQFADRSLSGAAFVDGVITADKTQDGIASGAAFADNGAIRVNFGRDVITSRTIKERGISVLESEGVGKFARGSITVDHIVNGAADADAIADGAISPAHMASQGQWVTQRYIADGGIKNDAFGVGSVTAAKLAGVVVATSKIASGNVTSSKISPLDNIDRVVADDTVFEYNFGDGAISEQHIQDGAVVLGKIGAGVTTEAIPANGIAQNKIPSDGFTDYAIKNKTLTGDQIQERDLVTTAKIADLGVTAGKIADNAITGSKITGIGGIISQPFKNNSMDSTIVQLEGFVVTAPKYRNTSLEAASFTVGVATQNSIADGGVSGDNFMTGSITGKKTDRKSIDGAKLANNSIAGADFAQGAVETGAFAEEVVSGENVKAGVLDYSVIIETGIDTEKIADSQFGVDLFDSGSFTLDKVDFSSQTKVVLENQVTEVELKDLGVAVSDIADGGVTTEKLKQGIVNLGQFTGLKDDNFAVNSVTNDKIREATVGLGPNSDDDGVAFRSNELDITYVVDGAITEPTVQDNSIGGDVFASASITIDHIAKGAAASSDFATGAVDTRNIVDGVVQANTLSADAITSSDKFVDIAVTNAAFRQQSIKGSKVADGAISWNNTLASVFTQASEATKLIDLVKHTVASIDDRCRTAGAKANSHRKRVLAASTHGMQHGMSMEDHHSFCARRGLGKAVKVSNYKSHPFHTLSQGKQLSAAASTSSSLGVVAAVLLTLLRLF